MLTRPGAVAGSRSGPNGTAEPRRLFDDYALHRTAWDELFARCGEPHGHCAALTDRLWEQVKPFYSDLHCYVRTKLNEKYGDAVQSKTGPIRADLLGNMWSQEWGNIYDVVAPKDGASLGYDLTKQLEAKGYTPQSMVKTAENFYISLGFDPWPKTFWERSMIVRPRDREVQCHASAWDIDNNVPLEELSHRRSWPLEPWSAGS